MASVRALVDSAARRVLTRPAGALMRIATGLTLAAAAAGPAHADIFGTLVPNRASALDHWIGFGALIALILLFAVLYLVTRRRLRRLQVSAGDAIKSRSSLQSALMAGRAGTLTWSEDDGEAAASPGLSAVLGITRSGRLGLGDALAAFETNSRKTLEASIRRLRERGVGFSLTLRGVEPERFFHAVGKRSGDPGATSDLIWLQDVSDRTGAILRLKAEAERLRGIVDAVPMPLWARDARQRLVDCNTAYVQAVEAPSRADVIREGREIAEGELAEAARAMARRALESADPQSASHHVVIDGDRRLLELTETPIEGGTYTAGYALDATAVEETRTELSRLLEAHDDVLDRLATAIIILSPERRLSYFNGAFAKMLKLDEIWLNTAPDVSELLDRLREKRMLPETGDFSALKREWQGWFTSLMTPREELLHLPNGTALWMVVAPHPLGGLLLTFEDVTDKLTLERSFNTMIEVQQATLDNLSDGIAVFGEDGCLRLSNPVFARLWGLTPDFIAGEPHIGDVIEQCRPLLERGQASDEDWGRFRDEFVGTVMGREAQTGQLSRADGQMLSFGLVPLPDGGVLLSLRDVTDTIRVEHALRERNDALEAADRLKSEFVANISYELRTPLNTIIGFTEMLNKNYFGDLNERQREYTGGILEASQRLLALINDILDLAVIEAGRMMLEIRQIDVRELVESVVGLTSEWAREQELKLTWSAAPDVGTIEGDDRRLKHALFNLISNAIKFTPPGGNIAIGARRDGDEVVLTVADTGIGIPKEEQDRVFEKFVRGRGPDGRQTGAGLGLSLVKSFVQLHGGSLNLESSPDTGTTVTCRLPARPVDSTLEDEADGDAGEDAEKIEAAE